VTVVDVGELLERKRELRSEAIKFIDKRFELKHTLSSRRMADYKVRSLYASNPRLSSFTEEDRVKFRE